MSKESNEENEELEGMASKLLKSRTVVISQQVDAKLTAKVLSQLVLLEQEGPEEPITVFINSPDCLLKFIIKYILKNETIYLEKVGNKVNIILQNQEYQFEVA